MAPDLESYRGSFVGAPVEIGTQWTARRQAFNDANVADRGGRRIDLTIALRERMAIASEQGARPAGIVHRRQCVHERVAPGADNGTDRFLECGAIRIGWPVPAKSDDEMHPHQRAFRKERIE